MGARLLEVVKLLIITEQMARLSREMLRVVNYMSLLVNGWEHYL